VGAPYISVLLPWLDSLSVSYLLWTWDAWLVDEKPDFVLIKDRSGTPPTARALSCLRYDRIEYFGG
jgi:hypothetical protein